jgi:NAD(P)-dependent dehydrogenase (short-subunit alcohol dehydrogenase family)
VVHDAAFVASDVLGNYRSANPDVMVLAEQTPAAIVEIAWSLSNRLDVLVSNDAYPAIHGSVEAAAVEDLHTTLDRLVVFPFEVARAAIPRLKNQAKARVVFISSNRNRLSVPGGSIPDIARAGANALVKSLSIELALFGIPVNDG